MAVLLKQSTAVSIKLGPFVDEEDGVTPEESLTISQADVRLAKNDGNWAQKSDSNAASHEENGWYEVALNATDTNTLGTLIVAVHVDGALPVWREFQVVPANVYDSLVAGSDNLQVDAVQIAGAAVSTSSAQIGVNVVASSDTGINSRFAQQDTGAVASAVWSFANRTVTNVTGFSDTGVNDRLSKIGGDADTGLRDAISDARYVDTGPTADLAVLSAGVNIASIRSDTGAASRLQKLAGNQLKEDGTFDTGTGQVSNTFNVQANVTLDTGTPVNVQVDTGLLVASVWNYTSRTLTDFEDTGVFDEFSKISTQLANADTGIRAAISQVSGGGSGADTGAIADAVWGKDSRTLTSINDTGLNQRLDVIRSDTDTGLRSAILASAYVDTGLRDALADLDTGLRDYITDTVPTANITAIKAQTDKMMFDTGGELQVDIRKVNNVTVTGTGDTGAGDTWRPA